MDSDERPAKIRKLSHSSELEERLDLIQNQTNPTKQAKLSNDESLGRNDSEYLSHKEDPVNEDEASDNLDGAPSTSSIPPQHLSKKQLKKLRKRQQWEAGREDRRVHRREKTKERRQRKRTERKQEALQREAKGESPLGSKPIFHRPVRLPVTLVIDCGFDDKMMEKERISLGAQITRAYSDNSKAPYQAHLVVSSWGGQLKERFDTVLTGDYKSWKMMEFTEDDFVVAAERAKKTMAGSEGGKMQGIFRQYAASSPENHTKTLDPGSEVDRPTAEITSTTTSESPPLPPPQIIYLTSDSPHTLSTLNPNSTYIIGGLVDKNRHKGICYKVAQSRGISTAKLPIGEFMEMQSRFVLATNHVVEIMLRYLECGDWGEAFMRVIPKRKGGRLKGGREDGGGRQGPAEKSDMAPDGVEAEVEIEVEGDESGSESEQDDKQVKENVDAS